MEQYNIRLEEAADWQEVENLTRESFWNVYRPGCLEHCRMLFPMLKRWKNR